MYKYKHSKVLKLSTLGAIDFFLNINGIDFCTLVDFSYS